MKFLLNSASSCLAFTLLLAIFNFAHTTEQLSFSGGGSFGAVEIGILKKIRENYPVDYDMYTGISAGGLNSGFLSHYENINDGIVEAEKIYSSIRNRDVYEILPETGCSLLNTKPLHKTLTKIIENIGRAPIIALTATATTKVREDIQKNLGITDCPVFFDSFNRDNLYYLTCYPHS